MVWRSDPGESEAPGPERLAELKAQLDEIEREVGEVRANLNAKLVRATGKLREISEGLGRIQFAPPPVETSLAVPAEDTDETEEPEEPEEPAGELDELIESVAPDLVTTPVEAPESDEAVPEPEPAPLYPAASTAEATVDVEPQSAWEAPGSIAAETTVSAWNPVAETLAADQPLPEAAATEPAVGAMADEEPDGALTRGIGVVEEVERDDVASQVAAPPEPAPVADGPYADTAVATAAELDLDSLLAQEFAPYQVTAAPSFPAPQPAAEPEAPAPESAVTEPDVTPRYTPPPPVTDSDDFFTRP